MPGVAEVANFGGFQKQFAVTFNQAQLNRYGLALGDVEDAIKKNNAAGGGSVVSRGSMSMVVRGKGQIENLDQIQNIFVKSIGGTPVYLKDIASVTIDAKVPNGIFSKDYQEPSVEGIVTMRKGENPSQVLGRVQEAVKELNETEMPPGVRIVSVLRSDPSHRSDAAHGHAQRFHGDHAGRAGAHLLPRSAVDGPAGGADDPVCAWCSPWCCCT